MILVRQIQTVNFVPYTCSNKVFLSCVRVFLIVCLFFVCFFCLFHHSAWRSTLFNRKLNVPSAFDFTHEFIFIKSTAIFRFYVCCHERSAPSFAVRSSEHQKFSSEGGGRISKQSIDCFHYVLSYLVLTLALRRLNL